MSNKVIDTTNSKEEEVMVNEVVVENAAQDCTDVEVVEKKGLFKRIKESKVGTWVGKHKGTAGFIAGTVVGFTADEIIRNIGSNSDCDDEDDYDEEYDDAYEEEVSVEEC